jgi:hypothetical protein
LAAVPELLVVATSSAVDARDLVRSLERHLPAAGTVRSAPGLLAARRDGEGLIREDARRRGAVICVLAPGGPDLANHALLTVDAARSAGLAVAVIVVAGPGGADQRQVLREHAGCDVVELPDPQAPSGQVAGWPLAAWLAAEPLGAAGAVAPAPYAAWEEARVPDPRSAGRDAIDAALLDIVRTEGPILAGRAYRLYNRAAGGRQLTSIARAPLSSSAHRLRQQGRLVFVTPPGSAPGSDEDVLHLAGTPEVRVRELGPRALDEVPLTEAAELMRRLTAAGHARNDLPRVVLDTYGLVRMTAKAEASLARAREVAEGADHDERDDDDEHDAG